MILRAYNGDVPFMPFVSFRGVVDVGGLSPPIIFQGAVGDLQRVVPLSHAVGKPIKTEVKPDKSIKSRWIARLKLDGWMMKELVCCEVVGF